MTPDQFWHGDVTLARAYREAYEIRRKRDNYFSWMQGRYVYDALCAAAPLFRFSFKGGEIHALPYMEEPYPLTEKEAEEQQKRKEEKEFRRGLKSASGWLRRELSGALNLRYTPELVFEVDHSIEQGAYISGLIEQLDLHTEEE